MTVPTDKPRRDVFPAPMFSDTDSDELPPAAFDAWCHAPGCGIELPYTGKGRRPKFCPEHRLVGERRAPKVRAPRPKPTGQNAQLAGTATEALVQLNGLVVMGLMLSGLPMTASALAEAEEGFRESTHAALLTDPDLCRVILRAGSTGGKVALGISYAMLAVAVAPTGVLEFKAKRAQGAGEHDGEDGDRSDQQSAA